MIGLLKMYLIPSSIRNWEKIQKIRRSLTTDSTLRLCFWPWHINIFYHLFTHNCGSSYKCATKTGITDLYPKNKLSKDSIGTQLEKTSRSWRKWSARISMRATSPLNKIHKPLFPLSLDLIFHDIQDYWSISCGAFYKRRIISSILQSPIDPVPLLSACIPVRMALSKVRNE